MTTIYIGGDPYTRDAEGEWVEAHHTHDADDVAAVRAYVDEATVWRRSS